MILLLIVESKDNTGADKTKREQHVAVNTTKRHAMPGEIKRYMYYSIKDLHTLLDANSGSYACQLDTSPLSHLQPNKYVKKQTHI